MGSSVSLWERHGTTPAPCPAKFRIKASYAGSMLEALAPAVRDEAGLALLVHQKPKASGGEEQISAVLDAVSGASDPAVLGSLIKVCPHSCDVVLRPHWAELRRQVQMPLKAIDSLLRWRSWLYGLALPAQRQQYL